MDGAGSGCCPMAAFSLAILILEVNKSSPVYKL